jgi:fatty acid desaturase
VKVLHQRSVSLVKSLTDFSPEEWQALRQHRHWPRFLLFPVLAVLSYAALLVHGASGSWWVQGLWVLLTSYFWFCIGGTFHEMAHQTLGQNRLASIRAGRIIGTFLVIPYTVYRETHIRHHAYLNTPQDWELWPYSDPGSSLWFRRLFVWFDVILAVVAGPVIYGRIQFARHSPLSPRIRRTIFREYMASVTFWGTVAVSVAWLSVSGTIELKNFNPVLILPLLIASSFNTIRKCTEHLGMADYDPLLGTRTVAGDNLVTRLCSYFNFEIFVHGPHHRYPRSPHYRLLAKLQEFQRERPKIAVPVFTSYRAAFFDALPWLFRNPGVGVNAGAPAEFGHRQGIDRFVSDVESEILYHAAPPQTTGDRKAA